MLEMPFERPKNSKSFFFIFPPSPHYMIQASTSATCPSKILDPPLFLK